MFIYELFDIKQYTQKGGGQDGEDLRPFGCDDGCNNRDIGHIIKELNGAFKRKFLSCVTEAGIDEVTFMHGWIMGYLHHNSGMEIYQKDIESEFDIKRSTVTVILQLMEKKGYIRREAVEGDARLKRILLTEQGMETAEKTKVIIEQMELELLEGIAEEELEIFHKVSGQLLDNLRK